MAVHRVHKTKDYSVISNVHLRDANLSLKTKGLLSLMLSLPDDWNYSRDGLVQMVKEGQSVIDACLKELEQNGYLVRTRARNDKGQLSETVYDIYEKPQGKKPVLENPTLDNPTLEKPTLENRTQLNTNITNINNNTNKLLLNKQNTKEQNTKDSSFDEFWSAYPKKVGKKDAEKAFKKVKVDLDTLLIAIEKQKQSEQWSKDNGKYIPNPSTWLNGEKWNDELSVQKTDMDKTMDMLKNFVEGSKR